MPGSRMESARTSVRFGVVLVVYHSFERVVQYVREELPKLGGDCVCVIVNNDSLEETGRSLAAACGADFAEGLPVSPPQGRLFLLNSTENLGYARGNNLGAEFLKRFFDPEYLLFSNDDIRIESENILEQLVSVMRTMPTVKMIGPRVVTAGGADQSPHRRKISLYRQIGWALFPFLRGRRKPPAESCSPASGICYWVSGAFLLVESTAFFACGKFDEATFLYCEEMILAERLLRHDWQCFFLAEIRVSHEDGASSQSISASKRRILLDSSCHYYRVYGKYSPVAVMLFRGAVKLNWLLWQR